MSDSLLTDRELLRAAEAFLVRSRPHSPPAPADAHALIQEFGAPDVPLEVGSRAILIVAKPCVLAEWMIDSTLSGSATLSLEHSPWVVPRVWTDMIGPGTPPAIVSTTNANSIDLHNWQGPFQLFRRDAIRMTVVSAVGVEQLTVALFMKELGMNAVPPVVG